MITSSVLSNKNIVDGKIDLLSNILQIDYRKIIIDDWILVDEQSAMLLDLISFVMYGTVDYVDVIKKFNKINNPLAIQIGQVLAIPNIISFEANSKYINQKVMHVKSKKKSSSLNISAPSKKAIPVSNFIKSSNGNLIF